jgi:predicted TIM-barrel fold metal-dependent hydrolase
MIDFHTHPVQIEELYESDPTFERAVRDVFGLFMPPQPMATYLGHLDEAGIDKAVILPIDCTTAHDCTIVSNAQVAALMERSDRLVGFASVDPSLPDAAATLERDVREYGLVGLKLDPSLQQFAVDDPERAFPVYAAAQDLGIPVLFHCGLSWARVGRSSLAHPLALESVIHAFPSLRIVIAHLGWPWVPDAVMLAVKHRTVHLDTSVLFSGTPGEALRHVVDTVIGRELFDRSLPEQVVFASNYPRVDPKRAVCAVRDLGLRPRLEQRIFHDNAVALLEPRRESER